MVEVRTLLLALAVVASLLAAGEAAQESAKSVAREIAPGVAREATADAVAPGAVAPGAKEESRRLVREAHAAMHHADTLGEGWEEAYDRGLELADRAIELDPENAEAYYARFVNLGRKAERSSVATKFMHLGEFRSLLAKTLELDPGHAHAWEARGELLSRLPRLLGGSKAEAEKSLRRAAGLEPGWAKPPLRIAELLFERGDVEEAREHAERARALAAKADDAELHEEADALLQRIEARR